MAEAAGHQAIKRQLPWSAQCQASIGKSTGAAVGFAARNRGVGSKPRHGRKIRTALNFHQPPSGFGMQAQRQIVGGAVTGIGKSVGLYEIIGGKAAVAKAGRSGAG